VAVIRENLMCIEGGKREGFSVLLNKDADKTFPHSCHIINYTQYYIEFLYYIHCTLRTSYYLIHRWLGRIDSPWFESSQRHIARGRKSNHQGKAVHCLGPIHLCDTFTVK